MVKLKAMKYQSKFGLTKAEMIIKTQRLKKQKEKLADPNKQITELMEKLREGPIKAQMHMWKIGPKFQKRTMKDIEIAMATV